MNSVGRQHTKWQPKEIIDLGNGCRIGVADNDGCFAIFVLDRDGSWKPTNWLPAKAAKWLGELASSQLMLANELG